MKIGIYVRVSTREQALEGYSIEEQTARLKSYCKAKKDFNLYKVYTDPGLSGSNMDRPALKKMIKDVENHKIDAVLVYKLDRLSRSQKDTLYLIEDVFLTNNVDFISMSESFDTSTAFGRAIVGILSVFAQLERENIKERTSLGREARAKSGLFHGGSCSPIGYDYINGELIINEYEALQVKEIYKLFLEGYPIFSILKTMQEKYTTKYGTWNHSSSIKNVLTNPVYCGFVGFNNHRYQGKHEQIITKELFEAAQKRFKQLSLNSNHNGKNFKSNSLLSGLLFCGNCGARYSLKSTFKDNKDKSKGYRKDYVCYSRSKSSKHMVKDPNCKNKIYKAVDLENIILNEITKLKDNTDYLINIIDSAKSKNTEITNDKAILENEIDEIDKQISKLLDLYQISNMPVDILSERIETLNDKKEKLQNSIKPVNDCKPILSYEDTIKILNEFYNIFQDENNLELQRSFLKTLINKIVIYDDEIKIYWNFQ